MNLDQQRLKYLDGSHQFIIMDEQYRITDSCNSLFDLLPEYGQQIFDAIPFLESFRMEIDALEPEGELIYPCINITLAGLQSTFDFSFYKTASSLMLILADRKDNYTQLQKLQQERNQSIIDKEIREKEMRLKSRFLANMSHEIRTPMNIVIGYTNLLLSSRDLSTEDREFANNISIAANNLLLLINDVLDLSKMEAGQLNMELVAFDLKAAVMNLRKVFQHQCDEKKISFEVQYDTRLSELVNSDPVRINQILTNLISNALKFSHDGGRILLNIKLGEARNQILMEVEDNGIGIDPDKQKKIFESFTQEEDSTTRVYGGTGLGLSIVKKLTDLLDGTIEVKSEKGEGSTFTIGIPYQPAEEPKLAQPVTQELKDERQSLAGKKILVAEDNKMNQMLILKILGNAGIDAILAKDGLEAVELARSEKFDAILMDVQMPHMDGMEATKEIRKNGSLNADTPIIAMTAHSFEEDIENCYDAGMVGYISKPFQLDLLFSEIFSRIASATPKQPG